MRRSPLTQAKRNRDRAQDHRRGRLSMQPTEQVNGQGKTVRIWMPVHKEDRVEFKIGRALASPPCDLQPSIDNGSRLESHRDAAGDVIDGTRPLGFGLPTDYDAALEAAAGAVPWEESPEARRNRQARYRQELARDAEGAVAA